MRPEKAVNGIVIFFCPLCRAATALTSFNPLSIAETDQPFP
jgi:hypothetical protein